MGGGGNLEAGCRHKAPKPRWSGHSDGQGACLPLRAQEYCQTLHPRFLAILQCWVVGSRLRAMLVPLPDALEPGVKGALLPAESTLVEAQACLCSLVWSACGSFSVLQAWGASGCPHTQPRACAGSRSAELAPAPFPITPRISKCPSILGINPGSSTPHCLWLQLLSTLLVFRAVHSS